MTDRQRPTTWCILRTAPSRTVPLVAALEAAGFDAWTPQEVLSRRVPRSKAVKDFVIPMMPSIAFAGYERLPELAMLSRLPTPSFNVWDAAQDCIVSKSVPAFTVFRFLDAYPRIADRDLDALRVAEQRGRPKGNVRVFKPGESVKLTGWGFEGLPGTVHRAKGEYVWVTFGGWGVPAKIAAVNLLPAEAVAA